MSRVFSDGEIDSDDEVYSRRRYEEETKSDEKESLASTSQPSGPSQKKKRHRSRQPQPNANPSSQPRHPQSNRHPNTKRQRTRPQAKSKGLASHISWDELAQMPIDSFTASVAALLQEKKRHLIRAVIDSIGRDKVLTLLRRTDEIQAQGGMELPKKGPIKKKGEHPNHRQGKRSPGGVFLFLLKDEVSDVEYKSIMAVDKQYQKELKQLYRPPISVSAPDSIEATEPTTSTEATESTEQEHKPMASEESPSDTNVDGVPANPSPQTHNSSTDSTSQQSAHDQVEDLDVSITAAPPILDDADGSVDADDEDNILSLLDS